MALSAAMTKTQRGLKPSRGSGKPHFICFTTFRAETKKIKKEIIRIEGIFFNDYQKVPLIFFTAQ